MHKKLEAALESRIWALKISPSDHHLGRFVKRYITEVSFLTTESKFLKYGLVLCVASNVEYTSYDFGIILFLTKRLKHLFSTSSCHSSPGPYPLDQSQFTWFSLKAQWLLWAEGHGYLPSSGLC